MSSDRVSPTDICEDCRENSATLNVRNRRLCAQCFIRYVGSKVLKRMESYRFKTLSGDQKRRLFLPISGGVSSLVLLQVLDTQLQRQIANRNRTAYDLVIARVTLPQTSNSAAVAEDYQRVARRFPTHTFIPILDLHDAFRLDDKLERDLEHLELRREENETDEGMLLRILSKATSATTRADLQTILLQRLLVSAAKAQNCESVLWGHSDSRLAALALAHVSKGRGGSVPSTISDGQSVHRITFDYPVRDLFKTELQAYAEATSDAVFNNTGEDEASEQPTQSIRNTSIDDLLSNYINTQGEKYPSIMANVVRTAGKLQNPSLDGRRCPICASPISDTHDDLNSVSALCYGCARMKLDIK